MITKGGTTVTTFLEYLYDLSMDTSCLDDECGTVDYDGWYGRIGRRIIMVDPQGRHWGPETFATEAEAITAFAEIRDSADPAEYDDHAEGYWQ